MAGTYAPGRPSEALVSWARRLAPLVRLAHRPRLSGVEHLPRERPYLLVANHSGGMSMAEITAFVVCYLEQVGSERPLAGFAHHVIFALPPFSWLLRAVGAVPSTYAAAHAALEAGVPLLVFPGGDHEATRPIWQAHRVDMAKRKGFLKIARRAKVPIIPMGIRGSHFTVPILARSKLLATLLVIPRLVRVKRWPLTALGVIGVAAIALAPSLEWWMRVALSWVWLSSPFMLVPVVPATIHMTIGPPIEPGELFGGESDGDGDDHALGRAYARVEGEIQSLVDRAAG
jgi:1-acyl-sn-glycerol-3-phosphate acyltransferase